MGVMILIYPPSIFPDASHGFQVMRSMQMGGGFNHLVSPDQDDISKNTSQFLTWWSPGQYLVPYFVQLVFGMNTGHATALVITLMELSGILGLYLFFKKIGFTPVIAALSIVFITCQQAFITPYVFYNGGEILLFGFEGWFLYGCIAIKKADIKLVLFVLMSGWIGFFCKSSFVWIYAAGLLCLWLRLSAINNYVTIPRLFKNGIWLAIPAIISLACIYIVFLSKGDNPAAASKGLNLSLQTFSFPLGSPLLAGFSIDELMHGLLFPTFTPFLTPVHTLIILILIAVASVILIACIVKYVPKNNYRLFLIVFYAVAVCFFSVAYLRQLTISYEARHFRIIGLLLAPGVVYLIGKFKSGFQIVFGIALAILAIANYSFFVKGYIFNKNISARGSSGIAQEFIDQPALNYVMRLDQRNKNAIFVFVSADISLEIIHNRTITIDPLPKDAIVDTDDYSYAGHAGPLYILLPANYVDRANMYLKFFPDYSSFTQQKLGSKYMLYSSK